MISLIDRPDDGGGTLPASWTLVHDDDFSRYLIYLNEGPFGSVSVDDLAGRTVDKAISLHSRLQSEVTSANGQPRLPRNYKPSAPTHKYLSIHSLTYVYNDEFFQGYKCS